MKTKKLKKLKKLRELENRLIMDWLCGTYPKPFIVGETPTDK